MNKDGKCRLSQHEHFYRMMTHELKAIFTKYQEVSAIGLKSVLATVVALEGSSYRRPGVRMLLIENGEMVGAVSGGCVEKEIARQAESVFKTGMAKVMEYDGRYRLGCEGILHILLESFSPDNHFLEVFWDVITNRETFSILSVFDKTNSENEGFGSIFRFEKKEIPLNTEQEYRGGHSFEQTLFPCFRLIIIGAEHDAVLLCQYASLMGWEVTVVANPKEEKTSEAFPGIHAWLPKEPETLAFPMDKQTAVIVMTHSFAKDLGYLLALKDSNPAYLGLLGPMQRREKLFDALLERYPEISEDFLDSVHGPAGLDIGAETPQEISISIVSEILTVIRQKHPVLLKEKLGKIHN